MWGEGEAAAAAASGRAALAAVAPRFEARLQLDGAELERSKSVWTTMGGADVRELFPSWAKVGRHQVELASGEYATR